MTSVPMELSGHPPVAYFSMEFGIDSVIRTYSGGLGVLAGDILKAAADAGVDMIGVGLAHRKGYFRQHLDAHGNQTESDRDWSPEKDLERLEPTVTLTVEGRSVSIGAWRYAVRGANGHDVSLILLDTDLPANDTRDRMITDHLYGGDQHDRLLQEVVLGFGGVAMLRALGFDAILAYHMNEGHSALLAVALLEERVGERGIESATQEDIDAVRRQCVFTTHTPVAAGHDKFPAETVIEILGEARAVELKRLGCCVEGVLNMTFMALFFSRWVNGVSMRHEEISQGMFPSYRIDAITNGVHAGTWTSPAFQRLFDQHIPQWRRDNLYLRYAVGIPWEEVWQTHVEAKRALLSEVGWRAGERLDPETMTVGFARRASAYKRGDLLFHDLDRLRRIARNAGRVQFIYAGKAHPRDEQGKQVIRRIFQAAADLGADVPVVYLEDYDMALGKLMCAGVDLWLNTPRKPQEASGTSGMKAALNGVPSLSVLDGWWIEGHVEGVTGWSIGDDWRRESDEEAESASLYEKLENVIIPMFYHRRAHYARLMRSCVALNGSFFTAQRMLFQYLQHAYPVARR